MNDNFTSQVPQIADEEDLHRPWSGGKDGKYFKCTLCGHKFEVGDQYRFVYNPSGINLIVCKECDNSPLEKWDKLKEEYESDKFWAFRHYYPENNGGF